MTATDPPRTPPPDCVCDLFRNLSFLIPRKVKFLSIYMSIQAGPLSKKIHDSCVKKGGIPPNLHAIEVYHEKNESALAARPKLSNPTVLLHFGEQTLTKTVVLDVQAHTR